MRAALAVAVLTLSCDKSCGSPATETPNTPAAPDQPPPNAAVDEEQPLQQPEAAPAAAANRAGPPSSENRSNRGRPAAGRRPDCKALNASPEPFTIIVELSAPVKANRALVRSRLTREGYTTDVDGETLLLLATNAELRRLFGAYVRYEPGPTSARSGWVCTPMLRSGRVPTYARCKTNPGPVLHSRHATSI